MASSVTVAPSAGLPVIAYEGGEWDLDNGGAGGTMLDLRRGFRGGACPQEGVLGANDWKVTATNGNLTLTVDANADIAVVQGDSVTAQGRYTVAPHSADITLDLASAPHGTNPRLDMVVLQVEDNAIDGSGQNRARVRVISGTATGGATLDNRTGAASLPATCLLLADILVPAGASQLTTSDVRDRRRWAYGACLLRSITGGSYTLANDTSSPGTVIDSTNLKARVECSGVPLEIALQGSLSDSAALNMVFELWGDGSLLYDQLAAIPATAARLALNVGWRFTPSAGSHEYEIRQYNGGSSTATLYATSTRPLAFRITEMPRANATNG